MKRLILLTIILLSGILAKSQDIKFQAMSVYNFTRTLQWPEEYQKGNFIICFVGETELYKELIDYTEDKKVRGEQKIIIQKASAENVDKCQMVIVSKAKTDKLKEIIERTAGFGTLIITEEEGQTVNGAGISFSKEDGLVKYEFNAANIKKTGISVSTSFKQIGIEK